MLLFCGEFQGKTEFVEVCMKFLRYQNEKIEQKLYNYFYFDYQFKKVYLKFYIYVKFNF